MAELQNITERYLTANVEGASDALIEAEALLRESRLSSPSWRFALAITLAKRSEILLHLGDETGAFSLIEEALQLFRSTKLGGRAGLLTAEAVQAFVRAQDADSKVKWRQS